MYTERIIYGTNNIRNEYKYKSRYSIKCCINPAKGKILKFYGLIIKTINPIIWPFYKLKVF
jgi:hypothetical protein